MTKILHAQFHVCLPDGTDIELMTDRAWMLVPSAEGGFHGLHEIVRRVWVTDDDEEADDVPPA